jgi:UDP-xylose/UDP-N-acetylglucosamine transporter B4
VIYTLFFVTVNLLNNWAFAYRISVPLHIILRSGGPVASMIIGYLYNGRRYSRMQIVAVLLLTFGVVGAALADAEAQDRSIDLSVDLEDYSGKSAMTFFTGFTILALAMLLSAFQGVYVDRLYAQHGNSHWREALLYSHMLSLPFFLPTYPQLSSQFRALLSSPPILSSLSSVLGDNELFSINATTLSHVASVTSRTVTPTPTAMVAAADNFVNPIRQSSAVAWLISRGPGYYFVQYILAQTPSKIFFLLINALTQYVCIRGVYLLAAKSSSLTVTIVLNIRKLVSLLFSIYIFDNSLATGVLVGAGFVFLGGALYGVESARQKNKKAIHTQQIPKTNVPSKIKV